ncbi:HD domain-containing protein [Tissierella creatinini]|nr:HD domain-containing protein [Tissierella creatinini]TJX63601.1 HD domain-containing protein [Soehngenia saccharolytica]
MKSILDIKEKLIRTIGEKRFIHSIGVMETAVDLAKKYGVDEDKARMAGLLHDCAKYRDHLYLLKRVSDFDIILDDMMLQNKELIHGPLGAKVAEIEFGIKDKEILSSIYYHTIGKEDMSLLEKIIYIADFIEPGRTFQGVDFHREYAFKHLDGALRLSMDNTIKHLVDKGRLIHLNTIKARNYLISIEKSELDA